MNLSKMTSEERHDAYLFAASNGNEQAMAEINAFERFHGKRVEVVKGRKIKHGTIGEVFYVKRTHFGNNPWLGWQTNIGFKTEDGTAYFTNSENLSIVKEF